MQSYVIKENVLTDDILHIANDGKIFKGGYIAIIEYYHYQNANSDHKHVIRFRTQSSLDKYLDKNYPDFEI